MQRKRPGSPAGSRQSVDHAYNPYDADAYDPLANPPSKGKVPLDRDDASNVNQQPRPDEHPTPPR
ncbi:MAG TPA: hypothetical protein VK009_29505 [Chloroflexota bacterium]|nr:hypothetical protein [Chloroflexota bacterium]